MVLLVSCLIYKNKLAMFFNLLAILVIIFQIPRIDTLMSPESTIFPVDDINTEAKPTPDLLSQ